MRKSRTMSLILVIAMIMTMFVSMPVFAAKGDTIATFSSFKTAWAGTGNNQFFEVKGDMLDGSSSGAIAYAGTATLPEFVDISVEWALINTYTADVMVYAMPLKGTATETDTYYTQNLGEKNISDKGAPDLENEGTLIAEFKDYSGPTASWDFAEMQLKTLVSAQGEKAIFIKTVETGADGNDLTGNFRNLVIKEGDEDSIKTDDPNQPTSTPKPTVRPGYGYTEERSDGDNDGLYLYMGSDSITSGGSVVLSNAVSNNNGSNFKDIDGNYVAQSDNLRRSAMIIYPNVDLGGKYNKAAVYAATKGGENSTSAVIKVGGTAVTDSIVIKNEDWNAYSENIADLTNKTASGAVTLEITTSATYAGNYVYIRFYNDGTEPIDTPEPEETAEPSAPAATAEPSAPAETAEPSGAPVPSETNEPTVSSAPAVTADPTKAPAVEPKVLTVDPSAAESETSFKTISAAVAAAKKLDPQSEAERVTINVTPGDYEEQVIIDGAKFITLRQTPDTSGKVDLHWYYCTGYSAANCDLSGSYNPNIDWYANPPKDEAGKTYNVGDVVPRGTKLTYRDVAGTEHTDTVNGDINLGNTGGLANMAPLIIRGGAENITVKDFNIVNSVPVMVTQGEKDAHLTPNIDAATGKAALPYREKLAVCDESTPESKPNDLLNSDGTVNLTKYAAATRELTAGESAWLARSSGFNERGHAISVYKGDKIIFENVRARGNQDSVYVGEERIYFKNCDLIGGTDYIYAGATAVFDGCKLGAEGMSDKDYGATITAANHDMNKKYGYLFYNCEFYNVRDNITDSLYGRPWGQGAQITFRNTKIDNNKSTGLSAAGIGAAGWRDMSGGKKELARFFENGTYNASGEAIDLSGRVKNAAVEEGGQGMGTVLDDWQILEFNPRNYFSAENGSWAEDNRGGWTDDWDPMNFSEQLQEIDAAIEGASVTIPEGEETEITLPTPPAGVEFKWESASPNAVVSEDGTKLTVIRPAAGMPAITSEVTLYARKTDTTIGDKKSVPVTINPTSNTTDVFDIPVTVSASAALDEDCTYTVTVTKNDALIKSQEIVMTAGEKTAEATLEKIPASAGGIDYDLTVVSSSIDMTITEPADGKMTVKGIIGQPFELNVKAEKQVDETISTKISYANTDGNKTYDLIQLAIDSGADEDILKSDVIAVTYTLDVTPETTGNGFIELRGEGTDITSRFLYSKLGHWNQLDTIDSGTSGFSGSSNTPNQWLNACGKFAKGVPSKVTAYINYKDQTITLEGTGSNNKTESYKFAEFPAKYEKGKLMMVITPGPEVFNMRDVWVTYKRVLADGETVKDPPTATTPEPAPTPDAATQYGTVTENADGSATLNFGENSVTTSNGGKMMTDGDIIRPDSVKATSDDIAVFTLPEIDLAGKYAKAVINMSKETGTNNNPNKVNVTVKVGETVVAEFKDLGTSGWNDYQDFTVDLSNKTAKGQVTIEITGAGAGKYVGNFKYLKLLADPNAPTPKPDETPAPEETEVPEPTPGTEATSTPGTETTPTPGTEATSTPGTDVTPTPGTEATSTPGTAVTPTPGTDVTPTPGTEATPTPGAETTPTPGTEATSTPGTEVTPTPGIEATPTPGAETTPEPTVTPEPLESQVFDGESPENVVVALPDPSVSVTRVTINGVSVPAESYTVENGVITFKPEFLNTLPNGVNTLVIDDAQGNAYSVDIEVSNTFEATPAPEPSSGPTAEPPTENTPEPSGEPTSAPMPTRKPSYGTGGTGTNSNFSTGGTTATAAPQATAAAAPEASGEPAATTAPDTTITGPGPATGEVQMPFTDVAATDWYYPYVQNVYSMGIMNGESETLFGPNDTLTRGMLVTILGRFDKADTSAVSPFADVDPNEYYAPYIAWAAESGIVDGVGGNMFAPNDPVTREQAAKIITGYYTCKGQGPTGAWAIQLEYTDLGQISDWAVEGVMFCTMKQVMTGNDAGAFEPQSPITRAEFAAVMSRI